MKMVENEMKGMLLEMVSNGNSVYADQECTVLE
jgi:hypothetical protein